MKKLCVGLFLLLVSIIGFSQVITVGDGIGPIPDDDPSGLVVSFPVTGVSGSIESVSLSVTIDHTYVGDLKVRLRAPNGLAEIVIFDSTGLRKSANSGFSVNLNGTYVFEDSATFDWWDTVNGQPSTFELPSGFYRSSTAGSFNDALSETLSDFGGCTTRMNGAFKGLSANQSNGTWTLSVVDQFGDDLGDVNGAILTINEQVGSDLIFAGGFDGVGFADFSVLTASNLLGTCKKSRFDFTGNGLADFVITRNTGTDEIEWTIQDNDNTTTGAQQAFLLGNPDSDFIMEGDIDGDGIKDPIVWRRGFDGEAAYYVRRSSRVNDQILKFVMGQTGDSPMQIGDYDGDGIEDFALFRAPAVSGQTALIIHQSSTGNMQTINMADGTSFSIFPTGGYDYTGDGLADIAIQRTSPVNAGVGEFLIYNGVTGILVDSYEFGLNTDLLAPGNYVGDDRTDVNIARSLGGARTWFTRETGSGAEIGPTEWGLSTNFILTGDYDGDGFDDYAVYDQSAGEFKFKIRPSIDPATPIEVVLGSQGIYPVANSRIQ